MKVDGVKVNFGRKVKLTLEKGGNRVVMEFNPAEDSRKCADIRATVHDQVKPNNNSGRRGFTAEVTVINPPEAALNLLAHETFFLDKSDQQKAQFQKGLTEAMNGDTTDNVKLTKDVLTSYYESRTRLTLAVGYSDISTVTEGGKTKRKDNDSTYTEIFSGYVTSNTHHRKGTDDILTMACFNFSFDIETVKAISGATGLSKMSKSDQEKLLSLSEQEKNNRSGKWRTWDVQARKLVQEYALSRPARSNETAKMTYAVTEKDRRGAVNDWFQVRYIYRPSNKKTENKLLRNRLENMFVDSFFTTGQYLNNMLDDLCNYKDADVAFLRDDEYTKGKITIFVYPRGNEIGLVKGENATHKIWNYQNLLDSPSASNSGALTIRMLLKPDVKPMDTIALMLDKNKGGTQSQVAAAVTANGKIRESMAAAGSLQAYYGAIQGPYSLAINNQDSTTKGYLFNQGFPVVKVDHKLETRGNTWETDVLTIPMVAGIFKQKRTAENTEPEEE